jgi:NAD(P)-dependent dehydrogenase (short-subunit alcohol dehydrogenase family)
VARLTGKTAIVTGGASGFGAGIVRKFVSEGARVMIADINGDAAEALAKELGAIAQQVDVSKDASVNEMAGTAISRGSGGSIFWSTMRACRTCRRPSMILPRRSSTVWWPST